MRLHDYLEFYARERPNVDFVVMGDRSLTYAEADARANQLANAFAAAGLQKGDRFAYVSKNSLEYPIVYFGASKAGVVPVPLNYRLAPPEWAYIVNDSQSKMLLSSADYQEGIDAIRGELETVGKYISIEGDGESGWDDFNVWVDGQPDSQPAREVDHSDDLYQMYTSGTTGRPKGTVLAHEAVTANMTQATQIINIEQGDRDLIIAPLYHAAAALTAFAVVGMGGTLVIHEDFIPPDVVRALSQGNIAYTTMVPAMIQACLVYVPDVAERNYDTLKGITYGNNAFVAVGQSGIIYTSSDGITWTSRTSGTSEHIWGIASGNGIFVAVGYSGTILTSPDGTTWTSRTSGTTNNLEDISGPNE